MAGSWPFMTASESHSCQSVTLPLWPTAPVCRGSWDGTHSTKAATFRTSYVVDSSQAGLVPPSLTPAARGNTRRPQPDNIAAFACQLLGTLCRCEIPYLSSGSEDFHCHTDWPMETGITVTPSAQKGRVLLTTRSFTISSPTSMHTDGKSQLSPTRLWQTGISGFPRRPDPTLDSSPSNVVLTCIRRAAADGWSAMEHLRPLLPGSCSKVHCCLPPLLMVDPGRN